MAESWPAPYVDLCVPTIQRDSTMPSQSRLDLDASCSPRGLLPALCHAPSSGPAPVPKGTRAHDPGVL